MGARLKTPDILKGYVTCSIGSRCSRPNCQSEVKSILELLTHLSPGRHVVLYFVDRPLALSLQRPVQTDFLESLILKSLEETYAGNRPVYIHLEHHSQLTQQSSALRI
jgi:hypothetical protein